MESTTSFIGFSRGKRFRSCFRPGLLRGEARDFAGLSANDPKIVEFAVGVIGQFVDDVPISEAFTEETKEIKRENDDLE